MDKKTVIEKVLKLLALANSDNESEAKLAAEKATELLTKYNLSIQEIEAPEYVVSHYRSAGPYATMEQKYIFSILTGSFFVRVTTGRKFDSQTSKFHRTWSFFGKDHNVAIAQYVYIFLDTTFRKLFKEHKKKNPKANRNSFYYGLHNGLHEQLSGAKKKVEQETGLVVVPDAGIDEFIEETLGKIKKGPSKKISVDSATYQAGVEEGKKIRIATSLESKSNSDKLIGGK